MEEASQTKKASIVPLGILRHADRMCRFFGKLAYQAAGRAAHIPDWLMNGSKKI